MVVCNYSPTGNWRGEKPYVAGTPCSKCPFDAQQCVRGLCSSGQSSETGLTTNGVAPAAAGIDEKRFAALEKRMLGKKRMFSMITHPFTHSVLDITSLRCFLILKGRLGEFYSSPSLF